MLIRVACDMLSSVREYKSPERVLKSETLPHFCGGVFFCATMGQAVVTYAH